MGVMSCYRKNCDNIMCDIYIPDIGYICYECKNEFKNYLKDDGLTDNLTENEILKHLCSFMETKKYSNNNNKIDIDYFFNKNIINK